MSLADIVLISLYKTTFNIKSIVIEQPIGLIPEIKSIEERHFLTMDQENGIQYKRAIEIIDEIIIQ
ncbi:conserved hypothetical protein [Flavobacterium sp. 9AF]|uniref:hypothetical protein n=1 Tax=Flavobacterium sp. 9AF TaxID=2653142 RepID=UPI0012EFDD8D|nr:hypothetical protein [Flavobacterium sp. 9AF]VXB76922.1 conserved hypothetical protein [Flavobacterium sp. 9AF]